jgi:hypothetical protein
MRMPEGYETPGYVMLIRKALYGLRKSPLLWYEDLTKSLQELGFKQVPEEPCCWTKYDILFFFYVDDITLAYRLAQQATATQLMKDLGQRYNLSGGEDLQWFLGIQVIRDRSRRLIWLSQAEYVKKIVKKYLTREPKKVDHPMKMEELILDEDIASRQSIRRYQGVTGSILYAAIITRPDVAFTVLRLIRFNQNLGEKYYKARDWALDYLDSTVNYAL